jgi:hypothetical protein
VCYIVLLLNSIQNEKGEREKKEWGTKWAVGHKKGLKPNISRKQKIKNDFKKCSI